jgi:cytochrome P450
MTKLNEATAIAKISFGIFFAGSFSVPLVWSNHQHYLPSADISLKLIQACIYRMCMHPEYLAKLRDEALEVRNSPLNAVSHDMPYMDSFIRETARLSPSLICQYQTLHRIYPITDQLLTATLVSSIRSVMQSYTTSDGCYIPKGNWIASPQSPMMRDQNLIPRAKEFDGFRFLDTETGSSRARLTHPSQSFLFWGSAKNPW